MYYLAYSAPSAGGNIMSGQGGRGVCFRELGGNPPNPLRKGLIYRFLANQAFTF